MKSEHILFRIAIVALLLCSISLGGLDQSGNINAKNMTISDFSALAPLSDVQDALVETGAPQATSADAGTETAVYTEQAPPTADLKKLMPSAVLSTPPSYMYYNGDYLAWNDFTTTFPSNKPGLWIERAVSWTYFATLPWGGWTKELLFVPQASPVIMYEIYPSGFVLGYNLGLVQPGYYYIWYYADAPGRHSSIFSTNNGFSNAVIIDVYLAGNYIKPNPPTPSPKEQCENKPYCHWVNNQCLCTMPPISEKEKCEQNPVCDWVNDHCYCRGLENPEKEKCEQNPQCDWVNDNCLCRGLNPEPMPGPVPNPNPDPEPEPFNPAPNPVADCESNPECQWANGRCNCMGLGGSIDNSNDGGSIDNSNNGRELGALGATA
jgi:hypothetical protein